MEKNDKINSRNSKSKEKNNNNNTNNNTNNNIPEKEKEKKQKKNSNKKSTNKNLSKETNIQILEKNYLLYINPNKNELKFKIEEIKNFQNFDKKKNNESNTPLDKIQEDSLFNNLLMNANLLKEEKFFENNFTIYIEKVIKMEKIDSKYFNLHKNLLNFLLDLHIVQKHKLNDKESENILTFFQCYFEDSFLKIFFHKKFLEELEFHYYALFYNFFQQIKNEVAYYSQIEPNLTKMKLIGNICNTFSTVRNILKINTPYFFKDFSINFLKDINLNFLDDYLDIFELNKIPFDRNLESKIISLINYMISNLDKNKRYPQQINRLLEIFIHLRDNLFLENFANCLIKDKNKIQMLKKFIKIMDDKEWTIWIINIYMQDYDTKSASNFFSEYEIEDDTLKKQIMTVAKGKFMNHLYRRYITKEINFVNILEYFEAEDYVNLSELFNKLMKDNYFQEAYYLLKYFNFFDWEFYENILLQDFLKLGHFLISQNTKFYKNFQIDLNCLKIEGLQYKEIYDFFNYMDNKNPNFSITNSLNFYHYFSNENNKNNQLLSNHEYFTIMLNILNPNNPENNFGLILKSFRYFKNFVDELFYSNEKKRVSNKSKTFISQSIFEKLNSDEYNAREMIKKNQNFFNNLLKENEEKFDERKIDFFYKKNFILNNFNDNNNNYNDNNNNNNNSDNFKYHNINNKTTNDIKQIIRIIKSFLNFFSFNPFINQANKILRPNPSDFIQIDLKTIYFFDNINNLGNFFITNFSKSNYIGIDMEWRTKFCILEDDMILPSTIQLSNGVNSCIIDYLYFKKNNMKEFNEIFCEFFKNKTFVGFAFHNDIGNIDDPILKNFFANSKRIDLEKGFKKILNTKDNISLKNLVKRIFNKDFCKIEQQSNWNARPLRNEQMEYGALDALILIKILEKIDLRNYEKSNEIKLNSDVVIYDLPKDSKDSKNLKKY